MPNHQKRIEQLRALIEQYRTAYYQQNQSLVSDSDYDLLEQELKNLEELNPNNAVGSPTKKVGSGSGSVFDPVVHGQKMMSLDNVFDTEGFLAWAERVGPVPTSANQRLMGLRFL